MVVYYLSHWCILGEGLYSIVGSEDSRSYHDVVDFKTAGSDIVCVCGVNVENETFRCFDIDVVSQYIKEKKNPWLLRLFNGNSREVVNTVKRGDEVTRDFINSCILRGDIIVKRDIYEIPFSELYEEVPDVLKAVASIVCNMKTDRFSLINGKLAGLNGEQVFDPECSKLDPYEIAYVETIIDHIDEKKQQLKNEELRKEGMALLDSSFRSHMNGRLAER